MPAVRGRPDDDRRSLFALVLVKFDEHSRSAQTDPAVVALYVAPVIHPTLQTGVEALIVAARAWLAP